MKKFNIYIGLRKNKGNDQMPFIFEYVQIQDNTEIELFFELNESTSNRALIVGTTKILDSLPTSSKVNIYLPTNIGFSYIKNKLKGKSFKGWTNKDLGIILVDSILNNKHKISFKNYNELEDDPELVKLIKSRFKSKSSNISNTTQSKAFFEIKDNRYNDNSLATTDVSIFVRGICDYSNENRNGSYYAILNYRGVEKDLSKEFNNTTSNRMVVQGAIDAIKMLKKPCRIKLYTHTAFGLVKFNKSQKGVNSDLLSELFELLKKGNHSLEEILGMDRQEELKEKITNKSLNII